jgi:putative lipoprotein
VDPSVAGDRADTISGTVWYRERAAMPPGAVLTVSLLDVSRADAPSEPIVQVVLGDPGNVPVDFELAYDPEVIDDRHTYAVRATIDVDGALWWTSTSAHLVVTNGHPTHVEVPLTRVGA